VTRLAEFLPVDPAVDQLGRQFLHDALPPALSKEEKCRSVHDDGERWVDGQVKGKAVMDETTQIKLVRGNVARLVNEGGELRLYHCLENSRLYQEQAEQYLPVDEEEQAEIVTALMQAYPRYSLVGILPGEDAEAKVAFVASLWEKGLLVTKEPIREDSDDE